MSNDFLKTKCEVLEEISKELDRWFESNPKDKCEYLFLGVDDSGYAEQSSMNVISKVGVLNLELNSLENRAKSYKSGRAQSLPSVLEKLLSEIKRAS